MKKRITIIILIILLLMGGIFFILKKNNLKENEYQPEEEIAVNQERKTMISLFFRNKTTNKIEPEARLVDVKELMNTPYTTLMNLLIEGPKKDNLEKIIPEGTKVNNLKVEGDTLIIDFSVEFIKNHPKGKDLEKQTIDSLVKTFTELTEIDSIKILIDGEENKEFEDGEIKFDVKFVREE